MVSQQISNLFFYSSLLFCIPHIIMKVLVHIYLADNLGDDLFAKVLLERYPHIDFYFLHDSDSYEFLDNYDNAYIIKMPRLGRINFAVSNYYSPKLAFYKYLINFKKLITKIEPAFSAFLTLGGSLFMEGKNEYLKKSFYKIIYGHFSKKPKFIIGSNFGPFRTKDYSEFFRKIFSQSADVCFRDSYSYNLFSDIPTVRIAPDVVFNVEKQHCERNKKRIGFVPISLEKRSNLLAFAEIYNELFVKLINKFTKSGYEVILYAFCKSEGDEEAVERIYSLLATKDNVQIKNYESFKIDEFLLDFQENSYMVCSRFHGMILGLLYGINTFPISYSKKISNVLEDLNFTGKFKNIEKLQGYSVDEVFNNILLNNFNLQANIEAEGNQFKILDKYFNEQS